MATKEAFANDSTPNLSFQLIRVLSLPWPDRTIAAVACVPLPYLAYHGYEHWHHGLPLITSALGTLILIGPMIIRRPPKRVRPNPWFRLLAFVASYWQLLVLCLLLQGRPLAPNLVTNSIAILGLLVIIWARFSLGRNIGFVPVQRELVRRGVYANMHHPLYTGGFFTSLAFLLRADSLPNLLLIGLGVFWFIPSKSLVEENFLQADHQYAEYMRTGRARWVPFLI